jgi:hypothetical protein
VAVLTGSTTLTVRFVVVPVAPIVVAAGGGLVGGVTVPNETDTPLPSLLEAVMKATLSPLTATSWEARWNVTLTP